MPSFFRPLSWQRILFICGIVALAAALRIWPLGALELRLAWLTFYPAVFISALTGGRLSGGLLATILCMTVVYFWSPTGEPFIKDGAGFLGMAVFFINCSIISFVSDRMVKAREQAEESRIQAEHANLAKSTFLSNMSHELRTPLNAIIGFSQILHKSGNLSGKDQEHIDIIKRSGDHLLQLINDVLDMSKIEAGKLQLDIKEVDLHKLLNDIIDMIRLRADKKDINVNFQLAENVPQFIKADDAKLRQIYINLLSNAVKFTDEGQVDFKVMLKEDNPEFLVSEVIDSGIGISDIDLEHIFNPFEQAGSTTGSQEGTGLGLAITKKLIDLMEGNIHMESELGKGTHIHVEYKIEIASGAEMVSSEKPGQEVVGLAEGQPEWRILIIDDVLENRQLLSSLLSRTGFSVNEGENGQEAIDLFSSWKPHFIWMDRRMPVMGGLDATKAIRQLPGGKEVVIAILTASALKEQQYEAIEAGANISLSKPFELEEIFNNMGQQLPIKYRYSEPETEQLVKPVNGKISRESLHDRLSAELIQQLHQASLRGDSDELGQLIAAMPEDYSEIKSSLNQLLKEFRFDRLVELLDTNANEEITG